MDLVRRHHCHRIHTRETCSVVPNSSLCNGFEKLGNHHWRTGTRFTNGSSLVELVWIPPADHARFDLDECQDSKKRGIRAGAGRFWWCLFHIRRSAHHVLAHRVASAMGILFCFDFRARTPPVAGANQVERRRLDCVRAIGSTDLARLGRTALAE